MDDKFKEASPESSRARHISELRSAIKTLSNLLAELEGGTPLGEELTKLSDKYQYDNRKTAAIVYELMKESRTEKTLNDIYLELHLNGKPQGTRKEAFPELQKSMRAAENTQNPPTIYEVSKNVFRATTIAEQKLFVDTINKCLDAGYSGEHAAMEAFTKLDLMILGRVKDDRNVRKRPWSELRRRSD